MRLDEALAQIANAGGLDAAALIAYAAEDTVGGRDTGQWPSMSTFAAEGQILYALVRALRPAQVVEIGVDSGGTTTHLLSALEANSYGKLWSVDIKADVGTAVPSELRHRWTLVTGDGLSAELPPRADFVFEDGPHDYKWTNAMLNRLKRLAPRIILSHDYYTHLVYGGFEVQRAFVDALGVDNGVLVEPSFTGLGYWWNHA